MASSLSTSQFVTRFCSLTPSVSPHAKSFNRAESQITHSKDGSSPFINAQEILTKEGIAGKIA